MFYKCSKSGSAKQRLVPYVVIWKYWEKQWGAFSDVCNNKPQWIQFYYQFKLEVPLGTLCFSDLCVPYKVIFWFMVVYLGNVVGLI